MEKEERFWGSGKKIQVQFVSESCGCLILKGFLQADVLFGGIKENLLLFESAKYCYC